MQFGERTFKTVLDSIYFSGVRWRDTKTRELIVIVYILWDLSVAVHLLCVVCMQNFVFKQDSLSWKTENLAEFAPIG